MIKTFFAYLDEFHRIPSTRYMKLGTPYTDSKYINNHSATTLLTITTSFKDDYSRHN